MMVRLSLPARREANSPETRMANSSLLSLEVPLICTNTVILVFRFNKVVDFRVMWASNDCVPTCNLTAVCAAG